MKDYKPVLENILKYIRCVEQIHKNHNYDREYFCSQNLSEYSLSVNMCILQIGELIKTIDDAINEASIEMKSDKESYK